MASKLLDAPHPMQALPPSVRRPFDVRRVPFYYGWVILAVGTMGMACAVPGSPPGLSVFIDEMLVDLSVSRDRFSLAYTLGTVTAGCMAPIAGLCIERYGARPVAVGTFLSLGLILCFTAFLSDIHGLVPGGSSALAFLLVYLAFGGIRVSGVAFGMTVCRSMIFKWFAGRRNWAAMVNGVVLSLSFSSAPVLLNALAGNIGAKTTWLTLGILFGVAMTAIALVFYRDSPESCGVPIESGGQNDPKNLDDELPEADAYTAKEALKTWPFWTINLAIAVHAIIGTGSSFHLVALGGESLVDRDVALALFLPIGLVNIATTCFFGWYSKRCRVRTLVLLLVGSQALTLLGLLTFSETWGQWTFVLGSGLGWGLFGILISIPWPRFYGRRHLGSINGFVTATTVITSGLGPYLFGLAYSQTGSFNPALWACLTATPLCFFAALTVKNPRR